VTDAELYRRGIATALACWEAFARGTPDAALRRCPGVAVAVFPSGAERTVYNNAILDGDLGAGGRRAALEAMEAAYARAGITEFAAWTHEADAAMRADLEHRGYALAETTRAMGASLEALELPRDDAHVESAEWSEHVRLIEMPAGFLAGIDHTALHVAVARLGGETVSTGIAFDHDGDCGIFNVGTLEHARRRGLGSALTAALVRDAAARGCTTASLQATEMAVALYAGLGFRDLGRILEYRATRECLARSGVCTDRSDESSIARPSESTR
jgi:ribosomal protein S18 acetylase RimI-like enzyme